MRTGFYLFKRLLSALLVIGGVLIVTFVISRIVPSDPARLYAGVRARPDQVAAVREQLRLEDPIPIQFVRYVGNLLQGDFGISFRTRRPILEDLASYLPATLEVILLATLVAVIIGIPLGVMAAARRGRIFDQLTRVVTVAGVSVPTFWLALLAQLLFFGVLGWLPLGGRLGREVLLSSPLDTVTGFYLLDALITGNWPVFVDAARHLVLPVAVLATYPLCLVARMTRAQMVEVLGETYVTAARASGVPRRQILYRLALKNAIIPTLTVLGLSFAYSVTGAVLIEIIFSWPGAGKYVTDAIVASDYPVVVGVTLAVTVIYVAINLIVDLAQAAIDPRIELG